VNTGKGVAIETVLGRVAKHIFIFSSSLIVSHITGSFIMGAGLWPEYFFLAWIPMLMFSIPLLLLTIPIVMAGYIINIYFQQKWRSHSTKSITMLMKYSITTAIGISPSLILIPIHLLHRPNSNTEFSIALIFSFAIAGIVTANYQCYFISNLNLLYNDFQSNAFKDPWHTSSRRVL